MLSELRHQLLGVVNLQVEKCQRGIKDESDAMVWTTVPTVVDDDSGQPSPPLLLAAARQLSVNNGRWPAAEGWWGAELFTGICVFVWER